MVADSYSNMTTKCLTTVLATPGHVRRYGEIPGNRLLPAHSRRSDLNLFFSFFLLDCRMPGFLQEVSSDIHTGLSAKIAVSLS